jgi:glycosyltransferase XagB
VADEAAENVRITVQEPCFEGFQVAAPSAPQHHAALPVEIAFLSLHGVPISILRDAAEKAQQTGVTADEILLRTGLVSEPDFYRALAAERGLLYLTHFHLQPDTPYPESVQSGLAILAGDKHNPHFVFAPRGQQLQRFLMHRPTFQDRLALVTPQALARHVMHQKREAIAWQAAHPALEEPFNASAREGLSVRHYQALLIFLCIMVIGVFIAPKSLVTCLFMLISFVFLALVTLRLAALFEPPRASSHRALIKPSSDKELPIYSLIVPLYREKRVLPKLINALMCLDYPLAKLDIKLVIEEDDHILRETLADMDLPGAFEIIIAPEGQPRTKPRALNVALPLVRGDYVVVYDAEDVPEQDQLRLAVQWFQRLSYDVGCLQAHLTIDNTRDSWLTRFFTLEYAALFDVINPGLAAADLPMLLGGTSNHFRVKALRALQGWDAWNVTEDADLGIRLALRDYRVMDLPSSTFEEAPITFKNWWAQRTRWMKGFMQVCIAHSRYPVKAVVKLGWVRMIAAVTLTAGTVVAVMLYPFLTLWSLWTVLDGKLLQAQNLFEALSAALSLTIFVTGFAAIWLPAFIGMKRRSLWFLWPYMLLLPLYYVLISLAAWNALRELIVHPFRWNKTEHGLAKTSRTQALSVKPQPTFLAGQPCINVNKP